jgi:hypothetical protein
MPMELRVRDATLYYEVRGSGPTLVFICGGPTDANVFTQIATALAGHGGYNREVQAFADVVHTTLQG